MITISIINNKGGVGKTTISTNLTYHLASKKNRCLFLDLDPQMAASFLFNNFEEDAFVGRVFSGEPVHPAKVAENIFLLNSGVNLRLLDVKVQLATRSTLIYRFKTFLDSVQNDYDYCIIDTPPVIDPLMQHIIMNSHNCIIPLTSEILSAVGLEGINMIIDEIKSAEIPGKRDTKYFIAVNMFAKTTTLQNELLVELRTKYPDMVLDTPIRRSVAVSVAQAEKKPISHYKKPVAEDFAAMFQELDKKIRR